MKISSQYNFTYKTVSPNYNNVSFGAFRNPKFIKDIFIKRKLPVVPCSKGLEMISGVRRGVFGGTICDGSIAMRKFWSLFDKNDYAQIRKKGISTNKLGIPNCFLKAKSDVPLSTSYVHDCSVMYLYNNETKTHALYHAAHDVKPNMLDFIMNTLMPEGVTHGIIVPGDSYWAHRHKDTLKNMFDVMKRNNPETVINVFNSISPVPEIVGYCGKTYEITNAVVQNQIKNWGRVLNDKGQASFKIMDLQGFNTFDKINYKTATSKDIEKLRHYFKQRGYNKEMLTILNNKLDMRQDNIEAIMDCKTLEELNELMECYAYDRKYYMYTEVFKKARLKFLNKEKI